MSFRPTQTRSQNTSDSDLGIIYLLTSARLAARLIVSAYSLRRFYSGPITIFTTRPESHEIGQLCVSDPRISAHQQHIQERPGKGYLSSYLTKTATLKDSPYRSTIFIDADTLVVGDISELLESARQSTVTATTFCGFVTTKEPTRTFIEEWRSLEDSRNDTFCLRGLIDRALQVPFQCVNAGVFSIHTDSQLLDRWDELTLLGRNMKTPEETALQLLLPDYDHHLLGHHFNCHPNVSIKHASVRIWHFAARAHLREPIGANLWLPAYRECLDHNIANITAWSRIE